jgi:hypothetical protein
MSPIFEVIAGIFKPATDLIDALHTSEEEKMQAKSAMMAVQLEAANKFMDYEKSIIEAQSKVIMAEAGGESWLQRNWRPVTMFTFLGLVVSFWMGYVPENVTEAMVTEVFGLIKLGLGGYVIGRSAEKIIPSITEAMKANASNQK